MTGFSGRVETSGLGTSLDVGSKERESATVRVVTAIVGVVVAGVAGIASVGGRDCTSHDGGGHHQSVEVHRVCNSVDELR